MPYVVALTGGIGSGKSSVAEAFARRSVAVVDTDVIAHELTAPGQPATRAIAEAFGPQYLTAEGALDRGRMRERVFSDAQARRQLESILHPCIRAEALSRIAAADAPYVVLVVPLLVETGAYRDTAARVLVVDCPEALQVERVVRRSGLAADAARKIMAAQAPRSERLAQADDVLVNDGDLAALDAAVEGLHRRYLALAHPPR
jgi:dephospho-CoA kinase